MDGKAAQLTDLHFTVHMNDTHNNSELPPFSYRLSYRVTIPNSVKQNNLLHF
jgi:hypothetical protein